MGRVLEQRVAMQASQHRKAMVLEMEARYEEEKRKKEKLEMEEREFEEFETGRLDDYESDGGEGGKADVVGELARNAEEEDGVSVASSRQSQLLSPTNSFRIGREDAAGNNRKSNYDGVNNMKDYGGDDSVAQLPINLNKIEYVRKGRKCELIYNALVGRSLIVNPKRFGADNENPSNYVLKNRVHMLGTMDSDEMNKFRPLSVKTKKRK